MNYVGVSSRFSDLPVGGEEEGDLRLCHWLSPVEWSMPAQAFTVECVQVDHVCDLTLLMRNNVQDTIDFYRLQPFTSSDQILKACEMNLL